MKFLLTVVALVAVANAGYPSRPTKAPPTATTTKAPRTSTPCPTPTPPPTPPPTAPTPCPPTRPTTPPPTAPTPCPPTRPTTPTSTPPTTAPPTCPSNCQKVYKPVCGSDGVSYVRFANPCRMKMLNCKLSSEDQLTRTNLTACSTFEDNFCQTARCSKTGDAVCGTDGYELVTSANWCQMRMDSCSRSKRLSFLKYGSC